MNELAWMKSNEDRQPFGLLKDALESLRGMRRQRRKLNFGYSRKSAECETILNSTGQMWIRNF